MKAVALIGGRLGQSKDLPDPSMEWWSLNSVYRHIGDQVAACCSRWFELHNPAWLKKEKSLKEYIAKLNGYGMPVYTWKRWPLLTRNRIYPKRAVERLVPHGRYHCGSFDWMLALAIHEGFKQIHLYGVDLGPVDGEPVSARCSLEYWAGVAEGRGIPVVAHGGALFKTFQFVKSERQYGYEDVDNVLSR